MEYLVGTVFASASQLMVEVVAGGQTQHFFEQSALHFLVEGPRDSGVQFAGWSV
nr:hypothetical protein [Actinopolymorpha alba]